MDITPAEVGTMSDEELATMLNDRWRMIIALLAQAGGRVSFTDQFLAELGYDAVLERYDDPVSRTTTLALHAVVAT